MKSFLTCIAKSAEQKSYWLLLALSAFIFELVALYFQYGMDLQPCIMCVYQRLAVMGVLISGLIGGFSCHHVLGRLISFSTWAVSAIWGLIIALEHVDIQSNSGSLFFTCEFVPNFPTWMPLHQWMPAIFEATGDCGEISWSFLNYSMPQWMVVIFAVYSLAFATVLLSRLLIEKKL